MAKIMKFVPVVLKNLFSKPVTTKYPAQPAVYPDGSRGHIEIEIEKCISCGICQMVCPSNAITVSKPDRNWTINRFDCVQCGSCTAKCPKKCLHLVPGYQEPEDIKQAVTYDRPPMTQAEIEAEEKKKAAIKAAALAKLKAKQEAEQTKQGTEQKPE